MILGLDQNRDGGHQETQLQWRATTGFEICSLQTGKLPASRQTSPCQAAQCGEVDEVCISVHCTTCPTALGSPGAAPGSVRTWVPKFLCFPVSAPGKLDLSSCLPLLPRFKDCVMYMKALREAYKMTEIITEQPNPGLFS